MNAQKKSYIHRVLIGTLITILFCCAFLFNWGGGLIIKVDGAIYDARINARATDDVDPRIVILDIDEYSLQEPINGGEGRWPWPRNRLAKMVDQLFDKYEIAALGFDVIFSEEDQSSGLKTLEQLAKSQNVIKNLLPELKNELEFDSIFAKSFKDRPVVLAYSFLEANQNQKKGALPTPVINAANLGTIQQNGYVANLSKLQKIATGAGHINPTLDIDGVIRKVPLLIEHEEFQYEALALALVAMSNNPPIQPIIANKELRYLKFAGSDFPVEPDGNALVPYRGPYKSFEYVSAAKVIQGAISKNELQGKIVLVGTTAPGLLDLRQTPVGQAYPGVEIHANLIAGLLDGTIREIPYWSTALTLATLLFSGLLLTILLPKLKILQATLLSMAVLLIQVGVNEFLFSYSYVTPLSAIIALTTSLYIFHVIYGYFFEARSKKLMNGLFGQYVPPELVDEMAKDPEKFSMAGESKQLSVLFSDVRGFTTISEGLDPKTLSELMNAFLTPLTEVIHHEKGTIDKYMGDCIMAFWGAPIEDINHPRNAVIAALKMVKRLDQLQNDFKAKDWPEVKIGVGVNTGRMSVGNMGSTLRLAYTVMGDAVNLASRLEGITKEYGVQIVIGPETKESLSDLETRELDRVRVKGKDLAVTIYEPLGFLGEVDVIALDARNKFEKALQFYRQKSWHESKQILMELLETRQEQGEKLFKLYLNRIAYFESHQPPEDWDGSFTFETK
jgi:adenylate cyclase